MFQTTQILDTQKLMLVQWRLVFFKLVIQSVIRHECEIFSCRLFKDLRLHSHCC